VSDQVAEWHRARRGFFFLVLGLFVFWLILAGEASVQVLALGAFASLAVAFAMRHIVIEEPIIRSRPFIEYVRGVEFLFYLIFSALWNVIYSNAFLIYQAITLDVHPRIVRVKVNLRSDLELTLISNLITLTPGTLVIDVQKADEQTSYLYVHFTYLKTTKLGESISRTIGRWDRYLGAMFE